MNNCPECNEKLYGYIDFESGFTQSICWKCGHYQDNSPAYKLMPESFKNIVRENPFYFLNKFSKYKTPILNSDKNNDKTLTDDQNLMTTS